MTVARIWFALSAVAFAFNALLLWALLATGKPLGALPLWLLVWLGHLALSALVLDRLVFHAARRRALRAWSRDLLALRTWIAVICDRRVRGEDFGPHVAGALRALDRVQAARRAATGESVL